MPTSLFSLRGSWSARQQTGGMIASGSVNTDGQICEQVTLDAQNGSVPYVLNSDSAQDVDFGAVTDANVVIIFADRKIDVALTSADGTAQIVPCDDMLVIISRSVPFTAITLTRMPATVTNVNVFLGQMA